MKEKLIAFIKARREQANTLRTSKVFAKKDKLSKSLREESARTMDFVCDLLEQDFDLKG